MAGRAATSRFYNARFWRWLDAQLEEKPELLAELAQIRDSRFWTAAWQDARRRRRKAEKSAARMAAEYDDMELRRRTEMRLFDAAVADLGPGIREYVEK